MAGRGVERELDRADPQCLAVAQDPIDTDRREGFVHPGLRIARVDYAGFKLSLRGSACRDFRAGQPLKLGHAADMVEMLVARADPFDVLDLETERLDVGGDQR